MLREVKQKFFGRVGATKFRRANAPKLVQCESEGRGNMYDSGHFQVQNKLLYIYFVFFFFLQSKEPNTFILKKMKVFYARYETVFTHFYL